MTYKAERGFSKSVAAYSPFASMPRVRYQNRPLALLVSTSHVCKTPCVCVYVYVTWCAFSYLCWSNQESWVSCFCFCFVTNACLHGCLSSRHYRNRNSQSQFRLVQLFILLLQCSHKREKETGRNGGRERHLKGGRDDGETEGRGEG